MKESLTEIITEETLPHLSLDLKVSEIMGLLMKLNQGVH